MVPGEGPIPARWMIIGEAPGRQECVEGRPFVGPSGKLLDQLLFAGGIAREKCYITNIVKELPLDDETGKIRAPFPEECSRWNRELEVEMAVVDPDRILLLGSTAYRAMTLDWDGKVPWGGSFEEPRCFARCFIVWHPSYVLRSGLQRWDEWRNQAAPFFAS